MTSNLRIQRILSGTLDLAIQLEQRLFQRSLRSTCGFCINGGWGRKGTGRGDGGQWQGQNGVMNYRLIKNKGPEIVHQRPGLLGCKDGAKAGHAGAHAAAA